MESGLPKDKEINDLAKLLCLIGNPLRLKILFCLLDHPCCVCDLTDALQKRQPCVSQHLILLRKACLVNSHHDGCKRLYSISSEDLIHCLQFMQTNWLPSFRKIQNTPRTENNE